MDDALSLASRLGWEQNLTYMPFHGHSIATYVHQHPNLNADTLLLLHGFPTSAWDWYKIWPMLAKTYTLVALDFLGFGLSDKPAAHGYSISEQADICEALIPSQGIERCNIIAHDYGDTVAQELLARSHNSNLSFQISKTVMLNGGILPEQHRPRPIQKLLAGPLGPMMRHLISKKRFKKGLAEVFGPSSQPVDAELNMMWEYITHNDGHRISHELLHYMAERKTHAARWSETVLTHDVPLCLINGALDPVSGQHLIDAYSARGGTAKIITLKEVGHYPQIEAAEETAAAIIDFLTAKGVP